MEEENSDNVIIPIEEDSGIQHPEDDIYYPSYPAVGFFISLKYLDILHQFFWDMQESNEFYKQLNFQDFIESLIAKKYKKISLDGSSIVPRVGVPFSRDSRQIVAEVAKSVIASLEKTNLDKEFFEILCKRIFIEYVGTSEDKHEVFKYYLSLEEIFISCLILPYEFISDSLNLYLIIYSPRVEFSPLTLHSDLLFTCVWKDVENINKTQIDRLKNNPALLKMAENFYKKPFIFERDNTNFENDDKFIYIYGENPKVFLYKKAYISKTTVLLENIFQLIYHLQRGLTFPKNLIIPWKESMDFILNPKIQETLGLLFQTALYNALMQWADKVNIHAIYLPEMSCEIDKSLQSLNMKIYFQKPVNNIVVEVSFVNSGTMPSFHSDIKFPQDYVDIPPPISLDIRKIRLNQKNKKEIENIIDAALKSINAYLIFPLFLFLHVAYLYLDIFKIEEALDCLGILYGISNSGYDILSVGDREDLIKKIIIRYACKNNIKLLDDETKLYAQKICSFLLLASSDTRKKELMEEILKVFSDDINIPLLDAKIKPVLVPVISLEKNWYQLQYNREKYIASGAAGALSSIGTLIYWLIKTDFYEYPTLILLTMLVFGALGSLSARGMINLLDLLKNCCADKKHVVKKHALLPEASTANANPNLIIKAENTIVEIDSSAAVIPVIEEEKGSIIEISERNFVSEENTIIEIDSSITERFENQNDENITLPNPNTQRHVWEKDHRPINIKEFAKSIRKSILTKEQSSLDNNSNSEPSLEPDVDSKKLYRQTVMF